MKEAQRISKLFEALYEGSHFMDVTIKGTLEQLSPEQAAEKVLPGRNSIWENVNHIIGWRLNVLKRMQGKTAPGPDDNYVTSITDTSEAAWRKSLEQLKNSQTQWVNFLKTFKDDDLNKVYGGNKLTYYEHIHGLLQHDAYHLGQIVLLTKL